MTGLVPISPDKISECIRQFQSERIGDILNTQCAIEKRKADLFSDHLLTEALLNVQEHPHATIGLVAISTMGRSNELILSVVDNGASIPETIYPRYLRDKSLKKDKEGPETSEYQRDKIKPSLRGEITNHATQKGVTSKIGPESLNAGMGLTYIKEDSINEFRGKLTIITDSIKLTYVNDANAEPKTDEWYHGWRGNLIRIAIPVGPSRP